MKNMSFSITTEQVINREKTVTRRWGWYNAKPGDRYRAVEKAMGLKKGEKMVSLAIIEVVRAEQDPLLALEIASYGPVEMTREGFPGRHPAEFAEMLRKIKPKACKEDHPMRIEFKYVTPCEKCSGLGDLVGFLKCRSCDGAGYEDEAA